MKTEAETESTAPPTLGGSIPSNDAPKVTISFKVRPIVKVRLNQEAESRGLTLSDLCESIIQTGNQIEELDTLKKKIEGYECEPLMKLFSAVKGEIAEYRDLNGNLVKLLIENPQDLFTAVIHSFKSNKK